MFVKSKLLHQIQLLLLTISVVHIKAAFGINVNIVAGMFRLVFDRKHAVNVVSVYIGELKFV